MVYREAYPPWYTGRYTPSTVHTQYGTQGGTPGTVHREAYPPTKGAGRAYTGRGRALCAEVLLLLRKREETSRLANDFWLFIRNGRFDIPRFLLFSHFLLFPGCHF